MSIRVLDPQGRPLRPVSRRKAAEKVRRGDARWLHAPEVPPDRLWGCIVMCHPVSPEPEPPPAVQVFDADGVLLGWVSRAAVRRHRLGERAAVLGSPAGEPHALVLQERADPQALAEVRRLEARRVAWGAEERERLREAVLAAVRGGGAWQEVEEAILALAARRLVRPGAGHLALEEVRRFRRLVERLDLAAAPDLGPVRAALGRGRGAARPERGREKR